MKPLLFFCLGLVVGALLLFGIERTPMLGKLLMPPQRAMADALSGNWQGSVEVDGHDVDFSLAVKTDGKALSGVISSSQVGDLPCDQIQIDPSGNIAFSAHLDDKDAKFTGKVAPDHHSMSGNLMGSVGDGSWSLAKQG